MPRPSGWGCVGSLVGLQVAGVVEAYDNDPVAPDLQNALGANCRTLRRLYRFLVSSPAQKTTSPISRSAAYAREDLLVRQQR